jgi:hypothetical protein
MSKLVKVDELTSSDHTYISVGDNCYYFMEYTARGGFSASEANQLIYNFKKSPEKKGTPEWKHKERAIAGIAEILKRFIVQKTDLEAVTFVPIPPSKQKDDPAYDDRMARTLRAACAGTNADIRELILVKESMPAAHESEQRPSIMELQDAMTIDETLLPDLKSIIFLFDDVLTTGAHYIACRNLIHQKAPEIEVYGVFIARRAIPPIEGVPPL